MRSIMEGMKIGTLSIVTFGTAIVYTVRKHPNPQCTKSRCFLVQELVRYLRGEPSGRRIDIERP